MTSTGSAAAFARAITAGDASTAEACARAMTGAGMSLLDLYDLLTHTLARVGDCWENGELTVAQEHRATAAAHQLVARLRGAPPASVRGSVLLTTMPGERHILGITVLEHLLETARFRDVSVGDVPVTDICDMAAQLPALRAVLISAHQAPDEPALRGLVRALRRAAPEAQIVVGGPAFARTDAAPAKCGADHVRLTAYDALATVDAAAGPLTRREAEVLEHLAAGLTNNQIGDALAISTETVKEHVESILRKLDVSGRTAAVTAAFRAGLMS